LSVSTVSPGTRLRESSVTHSFTVLAQQARAAGLQARAPWFYGLLFAGLLVALGGTVSGFILLGDSWLQLLMAGALGIILTQFAFLGHEASHRQILASGPANDRIGRLLATLFVGISYQWWMDKHNRHHANPNNVGKDPDVARDTISFLEEDAAVQRGFSRWLTRRQGYLFFPLLLLEGVNLHLNSIRSLVVRRRAGRGFELTMIGIRFGVYLALLFWLMPIGLGFAFLGVQLAVFGLYMGASFAPNHKGMPIVPREAKLDFFSKQVRTSRNISGGWGISLLMGGLNYQIEHHLFPSMARPNLRKARLLVRQHCQTNDVPYTETTLIRSYGIVVNYLNRVGLAARDPFDCPLAGQLGR
jgi:fatty acid desaturase